MPAMFPMAENNERDLDAHPEWSLNDVCENLNLSREAAQDIIMRRLAIKLAKPNVTLVPPSK